MRLSDAQQRAVWQMGLRGRVWPGRVKLRTLGSLIERGLCASYFSSAFGGSRFYALTFTGRKIYRERLKGVLANGQSGEGRDK